MEKKPYKTGGVLVTDGDGKILKFTKAQVLKRIRDMQKRLGLEKHVNYYHVSDQGEYWTASAGVKLKTFY